MRLGGLEHDKERLFLLSTTHGAENHALAAAIATMDVYQNKPVVECLHRQGERLRKGIEPIIEKLELTKQFGIAGRACNLVYTTADSSGKPSQPFRTLFMQEIIKRGVIGPSFVMSYSHTDSDIDRTIEVVAEALVIYRRALDEGIDKYLVGRPVKPVDRKFN